MTDEELLAQIESRFADDNQAEEFIRMRRDAPYSLVGPEADLTSLLYVTKPRTICGLLSVQENFPPRGVAILGRYGLPNPFDVTWIERLSASRPILFLGDADPVDLLTFTWLRLRLPAIDFRYLGVSDHLIAASGMSISPKVTISLAADERAAVDLVGEAIVNLPELLGPDCAALLANGSKIEVEALISFGSRFLAALWEQCGGD